MSKSRLSPSSRRPLTVRYIPGPAIDQPIAMVTAAGAKSYFHANHQGSVIAMSDASGAKVEGPYTYDPYGNCFSGGSPCGSTGEPYRFTGRRLDPETGLYYFRARYYTSVLGRFMQTDPVGYTADLNLYPYAGNEPIDRDDPTGLDWVYIQSTGSLVHYNFTFRSMPSAESISRVTYNYKTAGYSGMGVGQNNPSMQDVEKVGPIPEGLWYIGSAYFSYLGNPTFALTPALGTDTYGRTLFRIHAESWLHPGKASEGCIVVPKACREYMRDLQESQLKRFGIKDNRLWVIDKGDPTQTPVERRFTDNPDEGSNVPDFKQHGCPLPLPGLGCGGGGGEWGSGSHSWNK